MPAVSRPYWVITERVHVLNAPAHIPCAKPESMIAFSDAAKLTAFLNARGGGRWEVDLVADREAALLFIADAHRNGVSHICFNCEPDGSGGHLVGIDNLFVAE